MFNGLMTTLAVALYGIVGGPGVGKTSIVEALKEKGEEISSEVASDYIVERMADGSKEPWNEDDFQYTILTRTLNRENEVIKQSQMQNKKRIFSDRAILDLYVYMDIRGKLKSNEFTRSDNVIKNVQVKDRYQAIFFVLPWGDGSKDYIISKDRHEDHDEAQQLTFKTFEVYSRYFPNLIKVPGKLSPKERADFVLQKVSELEACPSV